MKEWDFETEALKMTLLDLIHTGESLDGILEKIPFQMVFHTVSTISESKKLGLSYDTIENSLKLYYEIQDRFPITDYPEKYI